MSSIELRAGHAAGAVLVAPPSASPGLAVAVALSLPVVAGLPELFRWVSDGDRVLVDGDAGTVTVKSVARRDRRPPQVLSA